MALIAPAAASRVLEPANRTHVKISTSATTITCTSYTAPPNPAWL